MFAMSPAAERIFITPACRYICRRIKFMGCPEALRRHGNTLGLVFAHETVIFSSVYDYYLPDKTGVDDDARIRKIHE